MVSPELFQWLLNCLLKSAKLEKIVLLGDHMQLPSVDPGNMLEDLYNALQTKGMIITLITNHRSEGKTIFNNATKISNQDLTGFEIDKSFIIVAPPDEETDTVDKVIELDTTPLKRPGNDFSKIDRNKQMLYLSLLHNHRDDYSILNDVKSQIISLRRVDCNFINDNACHIYNEHFTWQEENKYKKSFQVLDKIIVTKNADVTLYKRSDRKVDVFNGVFNGKFKEDENIELKETVERLMNGQMFKIRAHIKRKINNGNVDKQYMVLDDLSGTLIRVPLSQLESYSKIDHSWAITIHKMQGSEADTIVYILSGIDHETWKHVYTAVTRGKKKVVIVGYYKELVDAIKRPYHRRQTTLEEKVRNLVVNIGSKEEATKKSETKERRLKRKRLDSSVTVDEECEEDKMTSISSKRDASSSPEKGERRQKRRLDSNASLDGISVIQLSLKRCENLMTEMERDGDSLIHKASECQEDVKRMMKPPDAGEELIEEQEARERVEARRLFENWWYT